jgi:hypothetical protein
VAVAYAYAEGDGPKPRELTQLEAIDRFGVVGVMGRPLGMGEIRRLATCQNVVVWHTERSRQENWAQWAEDNPEKDAILNEAMRLAKEMGLTDG